MYGWVGWREAGHVDRLGGESVATDFFHVFVPVWPRGCSHYRFVTPAGEHGEIAIPRDRRSLVLGLVRTPLWLATVIVGSPALFDPGRWGHLLPIALVLGAVAARLTFAAGRLSARERARRALLQRVAGLGAPPELLPSDMREDLADELADRWWREFETDWRAAIHRGVASEVLVAIAEYHRSTELVIRAWTNLVDRGKN